MNTQLNHSAKTVAQKTPSIEVNRLEPDHEQATQFLETLGFNPNDKLPLRTFAGKPAKQFPDTRPQNLSNLPPQQSQNCGVYITVNGNYGAHKKAEITQARAIFFEHDDLSKEEQIYLWKKLGLPEPTIQVSTRNSIHNYWVFSEPITKDQFNELQPDLIAFAKSDKACKDISRVMRVAGYYHIQYGLEPELCKIISNSGKYYSFDEMRSHIPKQQPELKAEKKAPQKTTKSRVDGFSTDDFLEAVTRKLDAEDIFNWEGHQFQYDASANKYRGYCPWHDSQSGTSFYVDNVSGIYKWRCPECDIGGTPLEYLHQLNGHSGSPTGDDFKTIVEWLADQAGVEKPTKQKEVSTSKSPSSKLTVKEAVSQAKTILQSSLSEIDENVELEELRLKTGMTDYSWQNNYIKPLRKEVQKTRLRLELNNYLKETDIIERITLKQKICTHYQLAKDEFLQIVKDFEQKQNTPEEKVYSFDDFIDEDSEELSWVVPGFLPLGETVILAALAKVGKSQLAMDICHAVVSNGEVLGEKIQNPGGVLMVTTDESPNSTKRRFKARGFKSLPKEMTQNLRVMPHLSITNLTKLEEELETHRPNLVIIDSLTSITKDLGISENDSEFARHIYLLKELISRYNSSCILIHHENKDKEAKGINKLAGNTRISASVWGIWQLKGDSQDEGGTVTLSLTAREAESTMVTLERNPQGLWASEGIFKFIGDSSDPSNTKRTYAEKIYSLLKSHAPKGLQYREIKESLDIESRTLSTVLNRMVNRKQITYRECSINKGVMVYAVRPDNDDSQDSPPPPPPSQSDRTVDKDAETPTKKETETPQHSINTPSTSHQQLSRASSNGGTVNQVLTGVLTGSNLEMEGDTAICQQQTPIDTGGEGSVNKKADFSCDFSQTYWFKRRKECRHLDDMAIEVMEILEANGCKGLLNGMIKHSLTKRVAITQQEWRQILEKNPEIKVGVTAQQETRVYLTDL